jgi:hypothetical protein
MSWKSEKEDRSTWLKYAAWFGLFLVPVVVISLVFGGVFTSVVTAPGRVINKTLETDNIIHNYEWFHDTSRAFGARVNQIASHKRAMATVDAADHAELNRYRIEIEGMRQSCRDMAARYNANASKVNRSIFMGTSVPPVLIIETCDA